MENIKTPFLNSGTSLDDNELKSSITQLRLANYTLLIWQFMMLLLFILFGGSQLISVSSNSPGTSIEGYNMFIGVEIMMFLGFGYLMTFMKTYGLGAVGFTMIVTAVGLQWVLFTESFFDQLVNTNGEWHYVDINIYNLLDALYAISSVLIAFGALIGKIGPFQLVVMAIIQLPLHSFNFKVLMERTLNLADMGGTYSDHMFGAYFGLSIAWVLGPPETTVKTGTVPDIFSLLGTLLLWIYWPSFVAGSATINSDEQQRALVNTILSLSSCTVITYICSSMFSDVRKFRPVDIQNATLAGGVAIGCTANLNIDGYVAIIVGMCAGLLSTFGYNYIEHFMHDKLKLHDTCGIHNLHALPSVLGGLISVFVAAIASDKNSDIYGSTSEYQWFCQLIGIVLCCGFAILSGLSVGLLLKYIRDSFDEFHDNVWWEVADDFIKLE